MDELCGLEWTTTDTSFTVKMPYVFLCDKRADARPCEIGWGNKSLITTKFVRAISGPELRQQCMELNRKCDSTYSYQVKYILTYMYVKSDDIKNHLWKKKRVASFEMGHSGMTPTAVMETVTDFCESQQQKLHMRIHHIISLEVLLTKGAVAMGGCPELVERYRTICHPAVCVCQNDRHVGDLCHHWFMDTLLGGNRDMKYAHPSAVFPNGRVTNFRSLLNTIMLVTDDVVWGGMLMRSALVLSLDHNPLQSASLGETWHEANRIEISINPLQTAVSTTFGETVLHECAHARVLLDAPYHMGLPPHGDEWLQRMMDIRKLLAYRLTDHSMAPCARTVRGHIQCNDCSLSRDTANPGV